MSCPKCEPRERSRRWLWWAGALVLLAAGAWLDHSSSARTGSEQLAQPRQ